MEPGQLGDCFVLLAAKDRAKTRDGKPYFRVTFRDTGRSATAMVWSDSAWFEDCEQHWRPGAFYKVRCRYVENAYGPQIEIDRIRPVEESDAADGFDPAGFHPTTRFDIDEMYAELLSIAREQIAGEPLRRLVVELLEENADDIRRFPAARRNHHAYIGGYLEHVLSVTKTALFLADKYRDYYRDMQPAVSKELVAAGAILHDIGKLRELEYHPEGAGRTAAGELIGHVLMGRDIVREKAARIPDLDAETLLRLEHVIVAHQNLPEWGSPIAPHTPEALLVHYADDVDAKFHMLATALEAQPQDDAEFTGRDNPLRRAIFRGLNEKQP